MSIFKKENGALVEYTNPLPADYVAPIEDGATSAHNYAVGAFALVRGVLRKITKAVTRGTAITNANSEITTVAKQLEEINSDLSDKAGFPDYSQKQGIIESASAILNYTPTEDGWLYVLTDGSEFKLVNITINDTYIIAVGNSIMIPVKAGQVVSSGSTSVRYVVFCPIVS